MRYPQLPGEDFGTCPGARWGLGMPFGTRPSSSTQGSPPGMFGRKRNGKQSEGVPNLIDMNLRLFSGSDYSFELRGSNRTCWDGCEFVIPGLILFGLSALAWLAGAGA